MSRLRVYLVSMDGGDVSGEWLVEGRLMADAVVRRIREEYPEAEVGRELVTIYDSESAWAREAWPLGRITERARESANLS